MKQGIPIDEFVTHYPLLFHMAEVDSWASIKAHGLLSTSALLDLFEIDGEERFAIESKHRPNCVEITHAKLGKATIRDQKPMRESALASCLKDCTPRRWYQFLNRHVFFWVQEERVKALLNARAYRSKEHLVLTVDTSMLLKAHGERVLLCPINSGSTIYRPVERSLKTFAPLATYPFAERRKLRGVRDAVAELTVQYGVPDIVRFVVKAEVRKGDISLSSVFLR